MIIDCFKYNNEEKMLNFRFHELDNKVDYFIICESTHTQIGNKKNLNFNINKYEKFKNKIIYLIYDVEPDLKNPWINENGQRNYLMEGLKLIKNLKNDDIIIISDLDEIPDLNKLDQFNGICGVYHQDFYYYNLNCLKKYKWKGSTLIINSLLNNNLNFQYLRNIKDTLPKIEGGWHFSYFMTTEKIIEKINNFADYQFNLDKYKNEENIKELIKNKKDIFLREGEEILVEENKNYLPKFIELLK